MTWLRRLRRGALVALLTLIVALVAAFAWIQTGPGKRQLAQLVEQLASDDALSVEIDGIDGFLPFDVRIARATVSDGTGSWLEVEGLALDWTPTALLQGRLEVDALTVRRAVLERLPADPDDEPRSDATPSLPVAVYVRHFEAADIALGEPVLGAPARLAMDGMVELADPQSGFRLVTDVRRIDETPGTLGVTLGYEPDSRRLTAEIDAAEPAGGVMARLLALPGLPAVSLRLFGDGPLEDWLAQLVVDAGADLSANAEIRLAAVGEDYLATIAADAALGGLVDGPAAALISGDSNLDGRALIRSDGRVTLDRVSARLAGGEVLMRGDVDWRRRTLDAGATITAAAPEVFSGLLPDLAWGSAEADLRLLGDMASPRIEATLAIRGLAAEDVTARAITAELFLDPGEDGDGLGLWGEGDLAGVSVGDPAIDGIFAAGVDWQIAGAIGPDGTVAVDQLRATVAGAVLEASGSRQPDGIVAADGTLAIADLKHLRPLAALPIDGGADLSWQARSHEGETTIDLEGTLERPRLGVAEVDALLSEIAEVSTRLVLETDGHIRADDLRIASGETVLTGAIGYAADGLAADWSLTVASVAPLSNTLGADVDGRLAATGRIDGPFDGPSLIADLLLSDARYDGMVLPDIDGRLAFDDLSGLPTGTVRLEAEVAGYPGAVEAGLAVLADGGVRMQPIAADYGGLTVAGGLALKPNGLVEGRLDGRSDEVSTLAAMLDVPLGGQAEVGVDFLTDGDRQDLRATAAMVRPAYGSTVAAAATLDLVLSDLAGERRLEGRASLSELESGGLSLSRLALDARGLPTALSVSLDAEGPDLSGTMAGAIAQDDQETRIAVDTLQATFRDEPFVLAEPAVIVFAPGALSIDRLALRIGQGQAEISGRFAEDIDASVALSGLSLALLSLVEPGFPVSGHVDGSARINGPAAGLEGSFALESDDLRTELAAGTDLPPAGLRATGRWSGGRMALDVRGGLPEGAGLDIEADIPFRLDAETFAPAIDPDGEVAARANGSLDVSLFDDLLAAGGNRVSGRLSVDLQAAGTVAAPVLSGAAFLNGGTYQNAFYGSRLDEITAVLSAAGPDLQLTELSATTPGGGTLTGTGSLALDPGAGYPFQLDAVLRRGTVVDTPIATATADADLRLAGSLAETLLLSGEVSILGAEFRIPDRLPVSVPDLPVEEVNLPPEMAAERAARQPSDPAAAVDARLDIVASARQAVFVRGRGLDVELEGDLTVQGTTAAPAIGGDLTLRSGTLDILGRRLTFQRGGLAFDGSSQLDPEIDLQAGADVSDATVEVEVAGRVSEPTITLRSVPDLPQDEIAARLLFGKGVRNLTPFEAVTLAQSVGQLTGLTGGSAGIVERMRETIGLDRLDVEVGEESGETSVSGGRYVGDGVYVGVEQGLDEQSSRVNVEIELTPNVKVESDVGADAEGRIGVNLEWDY